MYLSVFGGANLLQDQSVLGTSRTEFSTSTDTGFVLGSAVGTSLDKWAKGLRAEVEVSYRRNDLAGDWARTFIPVSGVIEGNESTFSIMANVWYDIDIGSKVRPYVGGGAGWARSQLDGVQITTFAFGPVPPSVNRSGSIDTNGFAWQLGAGINYEVMPDVDLGIGYRYMDAPNVDAFFFGKGGKLKSNNHAVQVSLTIGIN